MAGKLQKVGLLKHAERNSKRHIICHKAIRISIYMHTKVGKIVKVQRPHFPPLLVMGLVRT